MPPAPPCHMSAVEQHHTPFSFCFLDQPRILNESRSLTRCPGVATVLAAAPLLFGLGELAGVPSVVSAVGSGCSFSSFCAAGAGSVSAFFCLRCAWCGLLVLDALCLRGGLYVSLWRRVGDVLVLLLLLAC